jgi:Holliday junction DNA helicase RuvB
MEYYNENKQRIIQELVPGKQITLAHVIANPDKILYKKLGLDPADRNLLTSIIENYGDNPVGLTTLAALTGDEVTTIEDFYEPYLLQIGFIEKTPRGRRVTPKAKQHLQKNQ